ncbi:MAG TPA: hypothetical protein VFS72_11440, partial [Agromyces sp.]|nr:hypothetical protein [Agromyces sp.]
MVISTAATLARTTVARGPLSTSFRHGATSVHLEVGDILILTTIINKAYGDNMLLDRTRRARVIAPLLGAATILTLAGC